MDITSLNKLRKTEHVVSRPDGIIVTVKDSWIIEGEDRLSYTTLIRLIECCREHHWQVDVLPVAQGKPLDSICKLLTCNFIRPIAVGSTIFIRYQITEVRRKSYMLKFEVFETGSNNLCAECSLVSVFYDPLSRKPMLSPSSLVDKLTDMCHYRRDK